MRANRTVFLFLFLWIVSSIPLRAEVYSDSDTNPIDQEKMAKDMERYHFETVTTKEGLKFSVPPDMPIQNKDGLVQPMEFDQYLYVKFKTIEERVSGLEKKFDDIDKKLDMQFEELKALLKKTP